MKFGLKVASFIGMLLVGMLVFTFALHLMSEPSDMGVALGVVIILGFVVVCAAGGKKLFDYINKYYGSLDRLGMIFATAIIAGSTTMTTGCGKTIPPGHVGIKVNKWGSDRGVSDYPLQSGWVGYNLFTEDVLDYPTSMQRVIWTASSKEGSPNNEEINYNSKDELVFHGDFTISYELQREKVPHFYVRFRNDDINAFTHGFFRDQVRDALNEVAIQYTADELYGEKKELFLKGAEERLKLKVEPLGVKIFGLGYASAPRPPKQVADAINTKITAIQRAIQAENELREATAQAKKVVAAAEGTAEANRRIAASVTPQIVEWRRLDVEQQAIHKWNGQMPTYSGGGAMPFIQLGK